MIAPASSRRLVGYARVSTDDQDLSLQIDSLTGLGIDRDAIFTEKISGAKTDRPELNACLAHLQQGDTLVVWRLDRPITIGTPAVGSGVLSASVAARRSYGLLRPSANRFRKSTSEVLRSARLRDSGRLSLRTQVAS
jgi:hypothetical protein